MYVDVDIRDRPPPGDKEHVLLTELKDKLYDTDVSVTDKRNGREFVVMAHVYHPPKADDDVLILDFSVTCATGPYLKSFIGPRLPITEDLIARMRQTGSFPHELLRTVNEFATFIDKLR